MALIDLGPPYGQCYMLAVPIQAPLKQTLAWLTDDMTTHNGFESRHKLRRKPRVSFDYTLHANAVKSQAYLDLKNGLRSRWLIPLWHEAQRVGTIAGGTTTFTGLNNAPRYLRLDRYAMVYDQAAPTNYSVHSLVDVQPTSLQLDSATGGFVNGFIVPLMLAWVRGDVKRQSDGYNDQHAIAMDVDFDDQEEVVTSAPVSYSGLELFTGPVLMNGDRYDGTFQRREDQLDAPTNRVARRAPWETTQEAMSYAFVMETPAEVQTLREFLHRRAGKYAPFWAPTFENNCPTLNTGNIVTTFSFRNAGAADDWLTDTPQTRVAFEDIAGTWYVRTLSGFSIAPTVVTATLDTALNVDASRIRRVSYLRQWRLVDDAVTFEWVGREVCRCAFGVKELQL
jgi:hypothetical protein